MTLEITEDMNIVEVLSALNLTFEDLLELKNQNINHFFNSQFMVLSQKKELDLSSAISKFIKNKKNAKKSIYTINAYSILLKKFKNYMHDYWEKEDLSTFNVSQVTKSDIETFLARRPRINEKKISPSTYNQELAILSSFFNDYLTLTEKYLDSPPTKRIKYKNTGEPEIRFLTIAEQLKILSCALKNRESGNRDYTIIYLGLNTGLRLKEITNLNIKDIDFSNDRIYIREGKGGYPRTVFLNEDTKCVMRKYLNKVRLKTNSNNAEEALFLKSKNGNCLDRLSREAIEKLISRTFRKAGIAKGSTHRLRHSFSVNLLNCGMNIVEIMRLLGHQNISTTIQYLNLDNEQILRKMKQNFPFAYITVTDVLKNVEYSKISKKVIERIDIYES